MLLGTDYSLGSLVRLKESVAYKETSRLLSLITRLLLEGWSILNTVFYKLSLRASFLGFFFFSRANTRAKRARGASHLRLEPFRSLQNRRYFSCAFPRRAFLALLARMTNAKKNPRLFCRLLQVPLVGNWSILM